MTAKEKLARLLLADATAAADHAVEQYRARKAENAIRGRASALPADSPERADFIVLLTQIDRLREEAEGFKSEMFADLKEAYGQGDWLNIHMMIQELHPR